MSTSHALKRWLAGPLVLAAGIFAAGCSGGSSAAEPEADSPQETPARDAIAIRVAPAERSALSELYSTSATLRPDKQATVTARTRGIIERLHVEEGARVRSGQILAELENDEQEIDFETAQSTQSTEEREHERAQSLFDQGLLSEEAFEMTRRELDDARQAFARAELALSRTLIRAPFSGRVVRRHLDLGAAVSDGTAIYEVADLDPLYADVNVPERHVGRLSRGQRVRLIAETESRAELAGEIERIAPAVDPETGTVKVTVAVRGGGGGRPGSFVRVEVVTDTHEDALVVPRSALVAEGRRWHLFRLATGGESVEQLEVEPGYEEGDRVEIATVLSGRALAEGESVVVVGASALDDGAPVVVVDAPRQAALETEKEALAEED